MIRTENYDRASGIAYRADNGTFGLKDGSVIQGPIDNVESEYDDPNGIGCIDVVTDEKNGYCKSVFADQFAWAEFDGIEQGDLPDSLQD